jgi:hypothetical protein
LNSAVRASLHERSHPCGPGFSHCFLWCWSLDILHFISIRTSSVLLWVRSVRSVRSGYPNRIWAIFGHTSIELNGRQTNRPPVGTSPPVLTGACDRLRRGRAEAGVVRSRRRGGDIGLRGGEQSLVPLCTLAPGCRTPINNHHKPQEYFRTRVVAICAPGVPQEQIRRRGLFGPRR